MKMKTVSGMELGDVLESIKRETRPIDGHTDPGAIEDCWNEVFETLKANDTAEEATASSFRVDARVSGKAAEMAKDVEIKESGKFKHCYIFLKADFDEFCKQFAREQREICAETAKVVMPSHKHLDGTKNVNIEEIQNAPEPPL